MCMLLSERIYNGKNLNFGQCILCDDDDDDYYLVMTVAMYMGLD